MCSPCLECLLNNTDRTITFNEGFMKFLSLLFPIFITLISTISLANSVSSPDADLLLFNGKIYTLDEKQPWVEAVAVKDGDIVFVGNLSEAKTWLGKNTKQQETNIEKSDKLDSTYCKPLFSTFTV